MRVEWLELLKTWGPGLTVLAIVSYYIRKDVFLPWRDHWLANTQKFFDEINGLPGVVKSLAETVKGISEAIANISNRLDKLEESCRSTQDSACPRQEPSETEGKKIILPPSH